MLEIVNLEGVELCNKELAFIMYVSKTNHSTSDGIGTFCTHTYDITIQFDKIIYV